MVSYTSRLSNSCQSRTSEAALEMSWKAGVGMEEVMARLVPSLRSWPRAWASWPMALASCLMEVKDIVMVS